MRQQEKLLLSSEFASFFATFVVAELIERKLPDFARGQNSVLAKIRIFGTGKIYWPSDLLHLLSLVLAYEKQQRQSQISC